MKKKCKNCGDFYEEKDQEIKLKLNHKDIEAIEDKLFCILTEKQERAIKKRINKLWVQLCEAEDKWSKSDKIGNKSKLTEKDVKKFSKKIKSLATKRFLYGDNSLF